MTKIKNTKKGMAKKTLSMSLVVAMLATSNVPVWAAEFSDGSDASIVTSEAASEFTDNANSAPVVENNETEPATEAATAKGVTLGGKEIVQDAVKGLTADIDKATAAELSNKSVTPEPGVTKKYVKLVWNVGTVTENIELFKGEDNRIPNSLVQAANVGNTITVKATLVTQDSRSAGTYYEWGDAKETTLGTASISVIKNSVADYYKGKLSVTGKGIENNTVKVGEELTAEGITADAVSYEWYVDYEKVADGVKYKPTTADLGKDICVEAIVKTGTETYGDHEIWSQDYTIVSDDSSEYIDENTVKTLDAVKTGSALTYTGEVKCKYGATVKYVWKDSKNNKVVEDTTNHQYFTKENGKYSLFAVIKRADGKELGEYHLGDTFASDKLDESITGTVTISNDASNQWGYENTAEYNAEVPEGITLGYQWQYYDADTKEWENIDKATGEKYTPGKEIKVGSKNVQLTGKKLRVLAIFTDNESNQVIKKVKSNNYEVAPLQIAADDITYGNDLNFYIENVKDPAKVDWVKVFKKDVHGTKENPIAVTEKDEYELITQDTDKPGIRTVTIKLKGAYSGEKTVTVNVGEFSLRDCKVTLENKYVPFVGDGQYAAPVIKEVEWANRVSLKEGEDYVVDKTSLKNGITYKGEKYDCINAGPQYIRLLGRGDFTGSDLYVPYEIVARSMENCKVVWTGKPVVKDTDLIAGTDVKDSENTHFVVVDDKGYVLKPDKDYTYNKDGLWEVSEQKCKVKISSKDTVKEDTEHNVYVGGNYYGSTESDYTTVGTNLENDLTAYIASVVSAQPYTGKPITFSKLNKISAAAVKKVIKRKPAFQDDLEVGVDFDITYLNNTNAYLLKDKDGKLINLTNRNGYTDNNGVKHYAETGNDSAVANDDPQAPQVYLTFKGKYSGQTTPVRFAINQADINSATLKGGVTFDPTATDASAMTTYADQLKAIKVIFNQTQELKNTEDYTYDYYYVNDTKDVSTENGVFKYEAVAHNSKVLEGDKRVSVYDGNFYGTIAKDVDVDAKSITAKSITVDDIANQKYSGKLIEPKVTVKDGSYTLVEGTDYQLSYKNNRSAGTATVTIKGKSTDGKNGRYTDSISKTFTIENKSIADAKIMKKGSYNSSYTDLSKYKASDYVLKSSLYNNDREVSADFDVVDANNNLLREGYDYTVEYKNNTKVGTATIVITGKGDYEGTLEGSFEILGKGISGHFVEEKIPAQTYTGSAIEPKVTFVPDSPNLVEGKDYEITYEYNVNPGKGDATDINNVGPKVVAHGIGQYAGYVKLGFEIKKADITVANVTAEDATFAGGMIAESKITVTNPASGAALKEGEDYTVEYVSGKNVGDTGKAILHLVNNKCYTFSGDDSDNATIVVTYNIVAKDLKDVTIDAIEDQTATGAQIKPGLLVKNGNVVLTEGVDYQVTYGENTEVGVGTATITPVSGNKNYTGSKEVNFNIVAAKPEIGKAMISEVRVSGNTVTPVLSGDVDGAVGYDYVIATAEDYENGRVDISKNVLKTNTNFYYVQEGTYYAYCHAWKRDENGKKVFGAWSNIKKFTVDATTPSKPSIKSVKVKGHTVTVTFTASEDAKGYDVVLGEAVKKVNGENRPVEYGKLVVKNIEDGVYTATFYNVPDGKYYAGVHSYNKTSNDGKKVFSKWGYRKTAISVGKAK